MDRESLKFAALETAQVVPVVGSKSHTAVARHLHSLGTPHAFRALGGLLSSGLLPNIGSNPSIGTYVHNEMWMHLIPDTGAVKGNPSSYIARSNQWHLVDFFVLLTVYRSGTPGAEKEKLELRVVVNSSEQAAPSTIKDFSHFILALWNLWGGKALHFKGVEDYLLDSLPGVQCSTRIQCLNYSVDSYDWCADFDAGRFSDSSVAQDLDLHISQIMPHDIDDVRGKNVISYDREYLEHCCPTSTCIRRSDTGAPVSWAYCHADYQIGVVLTLSEYRSRGLAKYVLQNLGDKMIQLFAEKMSLLYDTNPPAYPFKLQMVTELTNVNTQRLFARFGLKPVARVSWAECTFDSKEVSTPAAHFQPQVLVAF